MRKYFVGNTCRLFQISQHKNSLYRKHGFQRGQQIWKLVLSSYSIWNFFSLIALTHCLLSLYCLNFVNLSAVVVKIRQMAIIHFKNPPKSLLFSNTETVIDHIPSLSFHLVVSLLREKFYWLYIKLSLWKSNCSRFSW